MTFSVNFQHELVNKSRRNDIDFFHHHSGGAHGCAYELPLNRTIKHLKNASSERSIRKELRGAEASTYKFSKKHIIVGSLVRGHRESP